MSDSGQDDRGPNHVDEVTLQSPDELAKFVEGLLGEMQNKFQQMSDQIIGRLDEMGQRVDDMEKNISDLMQQVDSKDTSTNNSGSSNK